MGFLLRGAPIRLPSVLHKSGVDECGTSTVPLSREYYLDQQYFLVHQCHFNTAFATNTLLKHRAQSTVMSLRRDPSPPAMLHESSPWPEQCHRIDEYLKSKSNRPHLNAVRADKIDAQAVLNVSIVPSFQGESTVRSSTTEHRYAFQHALNPPTVDRLRTCRASSPHQAAHPSDSSTLDSNARFIVKPYIGHLSTSPPTVQLPTANFSFGPLAQDYRNAEVTVPSRHPAHPHHPPRSKSRTDRTE